MTDMAPRVAIYCRVSSEEQKESQTIDAQLDFLTRYCDLMGTPVAGVYRDDGVTGTLPLAERPAGRALLVAAESGAFSQVVIHRIDRLGRSLRVLVEAFERLDGMGVKLRSATEPFDSSTPLGTFVFHLLSSLAELDRATMLDRLTLGRDRVARTGRYLSGPVPLGYDLDEERHYVPSVRMIPGIGMTEAALVADLFARVAAGATVLGECQRLTALGVLPQRTYGRKGSTMPVPRQWHAGSLARILHNPVYKGELVLASRRGPVTAAVPALVTPDVWAAAAVSMTRNRKLSAKNSRNVYLLRGLVVCGNCGRGFMGTTNHTARGDESFYCCVGSTAAAELDRAKRCRSKYVPSMELESVVWDACRSMLADPERHLDALMAERQRPAVPAVDLAHLDAQLTLKASERSRVISLHRRGRITDPEADAELDQIAREAAELDALRTAVTASRQLADAEGQRRTDRRAILRTLAAQMAVAEGDAVMKRAIIETLIERIVITSEGVRGRRTYQVEIVPVG